MGRFHYDQSAGIVLDDRTLAHVQVIIIDKLRRGERFAFSAPSGSRLVTMWMTPDAALEFVYDDARMPNLNRDWLESLSNSAGSPMGLVLLPESPPQGFDTEDAAGGTVTA